MVPLGAAPGGLAAALWFKTNRNKWFITCIVSAPLEAAPAAWPLQWSYRIRIVRKNNN